MPIFERQQQASGDTRERDGCAPSCSQTAPTTTIAPTIKTRKGAAPSPTLNAL